MQEVAAVSVETTFASLQEVFGFVPSLFRAQTLLPRAIAAEAAIAKAVLGQEGALSRTRKEFMLLAVAAAYRNTYCVALHNQMLRSMGAVESQLDQFLSDYCAGLSARNAALIDFAVKLAINPTWISASDIAIPQQRGVADEGILEAILATALSNFLCTLAIGLDPSLDFELRAIRRNQNVSPPDEHAHVGAVSGPYLRSVELSPDSFGPFAFFLERFGFIPNIFRAQTLRPDVIEAEAVLVRNVLLPEDFLSHFQKECILLVGSAVNLNTYCVAVHCEMLRAMGVSVEQSDQIAVDHHLADLSSANIALLDFAHKLTARPLEFHRDDREALRTRGFTEGQILEAVVVIALNNFFNMLQMGLGTTPDIEPRHVFAPKEVHLPVAANGLIEHIQADPQTDPDIELVTRVQNGELDAFEELIHRHRRRVYRTLVAIVGNLEEAQDATQDTFLKAFEHIGRFEGRSKFSTWLLAIASNNGMQRLRERRPLERLDDLGDEAELRPRHVAAWHVDPEQLYSLAERRSLVESGLMKVPSKYRAVLVLRDIEQLSTEEAAAVLGLGISALKARLFRGRMMLREALSAYFAIGSQMMGS
jgi:RNA polymerase sigma-70 factor (ECF subfamily)